MKLAFGKKKSLFFRVALLALAIYVVVSLIQLNLQFDEKMQELGELIRKTEYQQTLNAELQDQGKNYEAYLEQQAREQQGMAKPGETILYETPGD